MKGIENSGEEAEKGRAILNSLFDLKASNNEAFREVTHKEFVKDPFGEKAKSKIFEESKIRKIDSFD